MDPADLRTLLDELRGLGNDTARVEAKRQRRPAAAFGDLAQQDVLRQTKVLVRAADGRLVPSLAGLLSLGAFPQTHLPQVDLSLVVYPTAESGSQDPAANGLSTT